MPIIKSENKHPLYHDLKKVFKLSNASIAVFCDTHPVSVSYILRGTRVYPGIEKRMYKFHKKLKETFPLTPTSLED